MVGDEFIQSDPECLSLKRMDMLRMKVRVEESVNVCEQILAIYGANYYMWHII